MADEEEKGMEERTIVVPLKDIKFVPRTKRANAAIKIIRKHVARHMKVRETITDEEERDGVNPEDKVWLAKELNEAVWARGREKPPIKITVKVIKFEDGLIEVSLPED